MSQKPIVLVCDDESQILRALRVILRDAGFEALPADSGEQALDLAAVHSPDAAILDLVLPDMDGVEVCRRLREWSKMPIIVLSAVGEEDIKVRALAVGADDYVTKPFSPRELIARLQAVLRRAGPEPEDAVIRAEGLEVDLAARVVRRDGEEIHLTPTEFDLLRVLVTNRGRLVTYRELLTSVWGHGLQRRHAGAARSRRQPAAQDRAARRAALREDGSARRLPLRCLSAAPLLPGQRAGSSAEGGRGPIFTKPVWRAPGSARIPHGCGPIITGMDALSILLAIAMFGILFGLIYAIDRV